MNDLATFFRRRIEQKLIGFLYRSLSLKHPKLELLINTNVREADFNNVLHLLTSKLSIKILRIMQNEAKMIFGEI